MRRYAPAVALAVSFLAAAPALADEGASPDAAHLHAASTEFDAGVLAFKHKDYEGAATHFEAADTAVPSPKALRQAMRARAEGGQGAQAATLAEQALARYGDDESTAKLARETLEKLEPILQKVRITCAPACVVQVGTKAVPGEANVVWVVYVDPGSASLQATFAAGGTSAPKDIDGKAGGDVDVSFAPKKKPPPPPPPPSDGETSTKPARSSEPSKAELPPEIPGRRRRRPRLPRASRLPSSPSASLPRWASARRWYGAASTPRTTPGPQPSWPSAPARGRAARSTRRASPSSRAQTRSSASRRARRRSP